MKPAATLNNVPVVFATDNGYAPYLYTAVDSLLSNFSPQHFADIIVLTEHSLDDRYIKAFAQLAAQYPNASIRFTELPQKLRENIRHLRVESYRPLRESTYYRLFLPQLLPDYERVIYCDVDVVIPGDIAELYSVDMGTSPLGAVLDQLSMRKPVARVEKDYLTDLLGRDGSDHYFNAGVLLLNLDRLRTDGWEERISNQLPAVENYFFLDQDLLNVVFKDVWFRLDFRWNFFHPLLVDPTLYSDEQNLLSQSCARDEKWGIIHFIGSKPWDSDPLLERTKTYYEWERYALRNPLIDWEIIEAELNKKLRSFRRELWSKRLRLIFMPTPKRRERYRRKLTQFRLYREATRSVASRHCIPRTQQSD